MVYAGEEFKPRSQWEHNTAKVSPTETWQCTGEGSPPGKIRGGKGAVRDGININSRKTLHLLSHFVIPRKNPTNLTNQYFL